MYTGKYLAGTLSIPGVAFFNTLDELVQKYPGYFGATFKRLLQ